MKYSYDYPNAKGQAICSHCGFETELPANFCEGCGRELGTYKKQGISMRNIKYFFYSLWTIGRRTNRKK